MRYEEKHMTLWSWLQNSAEAHFIFATLLAILLAVLTARRIQTQVLTQSLSVLVLILGTAGVLMTFPSVRQFGASLLASAGLAGLVVPLQWIIENPFQNWTRRTSELIGSVFFWLDYAVPLAAFREEAERLCKEVPHLRDGDVFVVRVTECSEQAMQVRVLAYSGDSGKSWDLRCHLRENLLVYVQTYFPEALPRLRTDIEPHDSRVAPPVASANPPRATRHVTIPSAEATLTSRTACIILIILPIADFIIHF